VRKSARWLIFVPVAVFAFVSPANASTISDGFDNLNDWIVIRNGGNGVIANGALRFSYQWGEIRRSVLVSEPSVITVVSVIDNSQTNSIGWGAAVADTYEIHVGTNSFVSNEIHGWRTVAVSFETTVENQIVDISLAGIDQGFWAGWYGPSFDSIEIQVATTETTTSVQESTTVLEPSTSTIPETTSSTAPISTTTLEATEQTTTTVTTLQTTTTEAIAVAPIPLPQTTVATTTTSMVETTTSTTETTTTTTTPTTTEKPTTTTSPEASVSLPVASENETPVETTLPFFFSPETSIEPLINSPDEVKKEFENQTNIFDGSHDDYVPVGSKINVAERRTIIAATPILMTLPTPVRRKT
jgi:hypothetical protein